jgi:hypothetical protein
MPIQLVGMLVPMRGGDGIQEHLRSHGHRPVGDESESHVIHLEAPNRRLFVEQAYRSLSHACAFLRLVQLTSRLHDYCLR